jgi:hypothetical protein
MADCSVNTYPASNAGCGFTNELPFLKNTDSSGYSIPAVDCFSKAQKKSGNKSQALQENPIFESGRALEEKESNSAACDPSTQRCDAESTEQSDNPTGGNLNTREYGVVGKGSAPGDAEYIGDRALDMRDGLTKSISDTKAEMYSKMDVKFDGIFGKGSYEKPRNHYEYVKLTAAALKLMNKEQQAQFKNDVEKIGQAFQTNFGLSRKRIINGAGYSQALNIPVNTYMVGSFTGDQTVEKVRLLKTFYAERDAALGRKVTR